jgi:hypothetical protein
MKPGTMYDNGLGRFTLVRIAIAGGGDRLNVWDVSDVETGAVRQLDEDEIFAADKLPAQVGQAWIDEDCLITLVACRRFGLGWIWDVVESDGHKRKVLEEALFKYYARIDGLDPETLAAAPTTAAATTTPAGT